MNGSERVPITSDKDVAVVRTRAREVALRLGFDTFAVAAITTASSELSRNVCVHGGGGHALVEVVTDGTRDGIRIQFVDQGPGIADLERALQGGWSSRRSLGLGLSGSRRLVDEFDVESTPGLGTRIVIVKWARFRR